MNEGRDPSRFNVTNISSPTSSRTILSTFKTEISLLDYSSNSFSISNSRTRKNHLGHLLLVSPRTSPQVFPPSSIEIGEKLTEEKKRQTDRPPESHFNVQ